MERNINMRNINWSPPIRVPTGDHTHNPGVCPRAPTRNRTHDLSVCVMTPNQRNHTGQGG